MVDADVPTLLILEPLPALAIVGVGQAVFEV